MAGTVTTDEALWPIVVVRYQENFTREDLLDHLQHLERIVARNQAFCVVFILGRARAMNAQERGDYRNMAQANALALRRYCRGCAVVTTSAIHRGVLTAMTWVIQFPFDVQVERTEAAGMAWAKERLGLSRDLSA